MIMFILPTNKISEKEMRFWLAENIGQCYKGIYGVRAEGLGWKYELPSSVTAPAVWKITIDDNDLATAFSMRFL